MKIDPLDDESLVGKFLICKEYGHDVDVWQEKYGSFDTRKEADAVVKETGYEWLSVVEVQIGYPWRKIKE